MSDSCSLMIWEVYAQLGLRPQQAVHLLRRQRVFVTPMQARQQLAQARGRNALCLVNSETLKKL